MFLIDSKNMYLAFLTLICFLTQAYGQYDYTLRGQQQWAVDYPQCGGNNQSPIRLNTARSRPASIRPPKLTGYNWPLPFPVYLQNTGSTVQLTTRSNQDALIPRVTYLGNNYQFLSIHFHWGGSDLRGSEHIINGRSYPLELHIVHQNTRYGSFDQAITRKNGLLVLGVMFERSSFENLNLAPIVKSLPLIRSYNASIPMIIPMSLRNIMGKINTDNYFTYYGSLTTPPCSEVVTWIVFSDVAKVSSKQLNSFRQLTDVDGRMIRFNYRLTQPLNGRTVYRRRN